MSAINPNDDLLPDDPREPTLENLLDLHRDVTQGGIRVTSPGQITDYNNTNQSASVQPLIQDGYINEDGTRAVEPVGALHNVPVMFVGGSQARITWPVNVGDTCTIWWSAASLARWVALGQGVTDPGDDRRHDVSDAICLVGLHSPAKPPTDAPANAIVLHAAGGITIKLGSSGANKPLLTTDDGTTFMNALGAAITAQSTNPPGAAALSALKTALQTLNWPVGSSRVSTDS